MWGGALPSLKEAKDTLCSLRGNLGLGEGVRPGPQAFTPLCALSLFSRQPESGLWIPDDPRPRLAPALPLRNNPALPHCTDSRGCARPPEWALLNFGSWPGYQCPPSTLLTALLGRTGYQQLLRGLWWPSCFPTTFLLSPETAASQSPTADGSSSSVCVSLRMTPCSPPLKRDIVGVWGVLPRLLPELSSFLTATDGLVFISS